MDDNGAWTVLSATVIAVEPIGADCFRLELRAPVVARTSSPGQFVMASVSDGADPLLRRPLSVHDVMGDRVILSVMVVGRGTRRLAKLRPGEELRLSGPHGNGFGEPRPGRRLVMIGGGIGAAPLLFAARRQVSRVPVTVVLGARTAEGVLSGDSFRELGVTVITATDDGTLGVHGTAVEAAAGLLEPDCEVWACGPHPMLASVASACRQRHLPCRVSVEAVFGCGVGACYGCAVPRAGGGYWRACRDGPVFQAEEVAW